jgi:hypothetical protein
MPAMALCGCSGPLISGDLHVISMQFDTNQIRSALPLEITSRFPPRSHVSLGDSSWKEPGSYSNAMKYKAVLSRFTTLPRAFVGFDSNGLLRISDKANLSGGGKMPLSIHAYFPVAISSSLSLIRRESAVGPLRGWAALVASMLDAARNTSVRWQVFTAFLCGQNSKSQSEKIVSSSSSSSSSSSCICSSSSRS